MLSVSPYRCPAPGQRQNRQPPSDFNYLDWKLVFGIRGRCTCFLSLGSFLFLALFTGNSWRLICRHLRFLPEKWNTHAQACISGWTQVQETTAVWQWFILPRAEESCSQGCKPYSIHLPLRWRNPLMECETRQLHLLPLVSCQSFYSIIAPSVSCRDGWKGAGPPSWTQPGRGKVGEKLQLPSLLSNPLWIWLILKYVNVL